MSIQETSNTKTDISLVEHNTIPDRVVALALSVPAFVFGALAYASHVTEEANHEIATGVTSGLSVGCVAIAGALIRRNRQ